MSTDNRTFGAATPALDASTFVDRRSGDESTSQPNQDRRQFSDAHTNLSPEAAELAKAVDQYKLINRRRYVTYEEMLSIIKSVGYSK
jgi:hypothetical protein